MAKFIINGVDYEFPEVRKVQEIRLFRADYGIDLMDDSDPLEHLIALLQVAAYRKDGEILSNEVIGELTLNELIPVDEDNVPVAEVPASTE